MTCSWCEAPVSDDDGFRITAEGEGSAVFCRLEHIVPWTIKGARWEIEPAAGGAVPEMDCAGAGAETPMSAGEVCSHCRAPLDAADAVRLVRHRGAHRIGDAFCDVSHLAAWAKAGGRWQ